MPRPCGLRSYDFSALSVEELLERLKIVDDQRIYVIAEAIRKGISYEQIHDITKIDLWFIDKIAILTEMEHALETQPLTVDLLKEAKRIEFPDNVIARLTGKTEEEIKKMRYDNGIKAVYKMVAIKSTTQSFSIFYLDINRTDCIFPIVFKRGSIDAPFLRVA